ncbi:MAG: ferritin family protein [Nitrospirae bacterium]|jgi:rubrerythrin|nr:ferritin family protein [Nitrospirota bacterium]
MNAIEIAIKMETDAINFYREASERTHHPVGKKMFQSIMKDEKRHLELLSQILDEINITIQEVSPMQNIRTVFETMKDAMMKRVEATTDELEAFKIAMNMEKEGIEFYKNALTQALREKEITLFKRLIEEEQQHYDIFSNTYFFLSDTGSWFMWEEHSIVDGGTQWA